MMQWLTLSKTLVMKNLDYLLGNHIAGAGDF